MSKSESGWTTERGYAIPPPAEGRNIANQPMKFGTVKSGENTFPGSSNPGGRTEPEIIEEDKDPPSPTEKEAPEPTAVFKSSVTTDNLNVLESPIPEAGPKFAPVSFRVSWQGCWFSLVFSDVWLQVDEHTDNVKWLTLVHDTSIAPEAPWTPPSPTDDEVVSLVIRYEGVEYTCSYFGILLTIPTYNLHLTVFLVTNYE